MNDPNKNQDTGIAEEMTDVGIDVALEAAGNVLGGAADIAGEVIGGIADGI